MFNNYEKKILESFGYDEQRLKMCQDITITFTPDYPMVLMTNYIHKMESDTLDKICKSIKQVEDGPNIYNEIEQELARARKYPPFHSTHEGYAVIKEELDELWDEIKTNKGLKGTHRMREEAIQVAAMAIKFIECLCDK